MNPYQELDVDQDADLSEIKSAYRKAAKSTHPDKDGDSEDFHKIHRAWLVLSDPVKRKRYDETGDVDEAVDNERSEMLQVIARAFDQVIAEIGKANTDIFKIDVIYSMKAKINEDKIKAQHNLNNTRQSWMFLDKLVTRFEYKGKGNDFISDMLRNRIKDLKRSVELIKYQQKILDGAIDILSFYSFKKDQPPESSYGTSSTMFKIHRAWQVRGTVP